MPCTISTASFSSSRPSTASLASSSIPLNTSERISGSSISRMVRPSSGFMALRNSAVTSGGVKAQKSRISSTRWAVSISRSSGTSSGFFMHASC